MTGDPGTWDKMKGKTNATVGAARGDEGQEIKGKAQEFKGDVKSGIHDMKRRHDDRI